MRNVKTIIVLNVLELVKINVQHVKMDCKSISLNLTYLIYKIHCFQKSFQKSIIKPKKSSDVQRIPNILDANVRILILTN